MGLGYETQSARSVKAFREIVWPEIRDMCGGGALRSLEESCDPMDTRGGIDAYQLLHTGIRTMTQRTQFCDDYEKPGTFTIRSELAVGGGATEIHKRMEALEKGYDLPTLVVQAYVIEKQKRLVRVGIAHARPFYEYVRNGSNRWRHKQAREGGNKFIVVPWLDIMVDNSRRRSDVPFASKDALCMVRTPTDFFAGWPETRFI